MNSSPVAQVAYPDYFDGPFGQAMLGAFQTRLDEFTAWKQGDGASVTAGGITVVLPSLNDSPLLVERAIQGIRDQDFVDGPEILLVNAGNESRTLQVARKVGAEVVNILAGPSFRADILNAGLEAADPAHQYVFTMPAHAAMASNVTLASAYQQMQGEGLDRPVAGTYGVLLPDKNASLVERVGGHLLGATERLATAPRSAAGGTGFLDASCSMVDRRIVQAFNPVYDPAYGNGGADGDLGARLLDAGLAVILNGGQSVHHTHGFVLRAGLQALSWMRMSKPRAHKPALARLWHKNNGL